MVKLAEQTVVEPLDGSRHPADPCEEEIRQLCLAIREGWSAEDYERRASHFAAATRFEEREEIRSDRLIPFIVTSEVAPLFLF